MRSTQQDLGQTKILRNMGGLLIASYLNLRDSRLKENRHDQTCRHCYPQMA
jgi:hypothetical protein